MKTSITRDDLAQLKGITPKLILALEQLLVDTANNTADVAGTVSATGSIQNGTVLTLSSNAAFNNERVVAFSADFTVVDHGPGGALDISLAGISVNGFHLTLNLLADTNLNVPTDGTLATLNLGAVYANDAAAAAGGVGVGEMYKVTAGNVAWRVV